MVDQYSRLNAIIGEKGINILKQSSVMVAGLGGVGSFCAEALVRCGIGTIGVMDSGRSEPSNLNRQLFALHSTLGEDKVISFRKRAKDINPDIRIETYPLFFNRETSNQVDFSSFDIVADCIDALVPKLNLILYCIENNIPIVASTGAGFKLDPTQVQAGSIWDTKNDPLAYQMRKKLRQWGHGNADFTVVYSMEERQSPPDKTTIASIVTVTGTFGLTIAASVLRLLLEPEK
ncbi:MAG: tRNA threonylcarbamoyladenosine dehydratase [Acidobacteria bacterium]|nr:tRNA threonylcarbamoyladenosine dehydratase [Acidobacteriota bacterium]